MKTHAHHPLASPQTQRKLPALTERLRRGDRRITGPRQAILDVLSRETHPLTNREIFQALPAGQCDLATVYRSMHLLEKMGMVQRFDFGDGVARWELVVEGEACHHHHLICTRCADVVEVDECFPPEFERKVGQGNGYVGITHKLEFFGICPQCQRP